MHFFLFLGGGTRTFRHHLRTNTRLPSSPLPNNKKERERERDGLRISMVQRHAWFFSFRDFLLFQNQHLHLRDGAREQTAVPL